MKKWVVKEKQIGETPLEVAENYRKEAELAADVSIAYAGRLDPMASGKVLLLLGDECKKQKDYFGEVIGINKISKHTSKQLFKFMDKFLVRKNKRLSWEIVLDNYINKTCDSLFVLKNQNYAWTNINYYKDFKRVLRSNEK